MQILIDIPDNYDLSKIQNGSIASKIILNAVANGTPLPKGHSDLIDRNELLKQPIDTANYPSNYVILAKAIIEAGKESEGTYEADN